MSKVDEKAMPREEVGTKDGAVDCGHMKTVVSGKAVEVEFHGPGAKCVYGRPIGRDEGSGCRCPPICG